MTDVHIMNVSKRPKHLIGVDFTKGIGKIIISFVIESEDFIKSVGEMIHD